MGMYYDENGVLHAQTLEEIKEEIRESYRKSGKFDDVRLDDESEIGKFINITAKNEKKLQDALEKANNAFSLSKSEGVSLDRGLGLTGVKRNPAVQSIVPSMYAAGTKLTNIPERSLLISNSVTGSLFYNSETFQLANLDKKTADSVVRSGTTVTVTISGGHSFPEDSYVFLEGAEQPEYNILAQVKNASGTTFEFEIDTEPTSPAIGTVTVNPATNFTAKSSLYDSIEALSGTLTVLEETVTGLTRVENLNDAVEGSKVETDIEAKVSYLGKLAALGGGTIKSIEAKLETVPTVKSAKVFENITDEIDEYGRRPHSVEAFVLGQKGEEEKQEIFKVMLDAPATGITQEGTEKGVVQDSKGIDVDVAFSYLTKVDIEVNLVITTNKNENNGPVFPEEPKEPIGGKQQIIDNLTSFRFIAGHDVTRQLLTVPVTDVPGIKTLDLTFRIKDVGSFGTNKIIIPETSIADVESGNISGTIDGISI